MVEMTFVENPRRKKRRRSKRKASPAQLRARKKFVQMVRARAKKRRNPRKVRRIHKAGISKKSIRHRPVYYGTKSTAGVQSPFKRLNPMKRHRKHRAVRKYRRNPSFGGGDNLIMSGLVGAGGVVVNNVLSDLVGGMLPSLGGVTGKTYAKVLIPVVAGKFLGKRSPLVKKAASVAFAVAIVEVVRGFVPTLPGLSGGGLGDYTPSFKAATADNNLIPYPA